MVTTFSPYTKTDNWASPGTGHDGVSLVASEGSYGTGSLLFGGRAILTAAHIFSSEEPPATVYFQTTDGITKVQAAEVIVHPDYDAANANNDLALVWLWSPAPASAERYDIYRDFDEHGNTITMVGFGVPGDGENGAIENYDGKLIRLRAHNVFEAEGSELKDTLGFNMGWTPAEDSQLLADFDNGTVENDALGHLMNRNDTGLGESEGMISPGDSGGPAFIGDKVAGVASYTASLSKDWYRPDVDKEANSSFGEIAAWQRTSHYQQWIDQTLRANYPDAPTTPEEVEKTIQEKDSGISLVYFLLEFTGTRETPDQLLSVDYTTRDGTATAGEDYLATSGRLVLYPDENQAVIPVEVLGDTMREGDETFYLDVTNPSGVRFDPGVDVLTAMRTIVDDDVGWA